MPAVPDDERDGRWHARLRRRVGRRGAFLGTFGSVFVLLGLGLLRRAPPPPEEYAAYEYAVRVMPFVGWGAAAVLAGTVAWVGAWTDRWSLNAAGFVGLQIISSGWSAAMAAAALLNGSAFAARSAVTWLMLTVALGIASGWPEPPR